MIETKEAAPSTTLELPLQTCNREGIDAQEYKDVDASVIDEKIQDSKTEDGLAHHTIDQDVNPLSNTKDKVSKFSLGTPKAYKATEDETSATIWDKFNESTISYSTTIEGIEFYFIEACDAKNHIVIMRATYEDTLSSYTFECGPLRAMGASLLDYLKTPLKNNFSSVHIAARKMKQLNKGEVKNANEITRYLITRAINDFISVHGATLVTNDTMWEQYILFKNKEINVKQQIFTFDTKEYRIPADYCIIKGERLACNTKDGAIIISAPFVITHIGNNPTDHNIYYKIVWVNAAGYFTEKWLPEKWFMSLSGQTHINDVCGSLALVGPYHKHITDYVNALVSEDNKERDKVIARVDIADCNGFTDATFTRLMAGERCFTKDGTVPCVNINPNNVKGFGVKGTLKGWAQGVTIQNIIAEPHVRFVIDAMFASLLMDRTNTRPTYYHLRGDTSLGKTSSCELGASCLGDFMTLVKTMNATVNALEAHKNIMNGFAVILDETTATEHEEIEKFIYNASSGKGKARSDIHGGFNEKRNTSYIGILTGEASYINEDTRGGQMVRLLEVPFRMKKLTNKEYDEFKTAITENYGHVLPYFMDEFFNTDIDAEIFQIKKSMTNESNIGNRINQSAIPIILAHQMLDRVFARISRDTGIHIPCISSDVAVLGTLAEIKERARKAERDHSLRVAGAFFDILCKFQFMEGEPGTRELYEKNKDGEYKKVFISNDKEPFLYKVINDELVVTRAGFEAIMLRETKFKKQDLATAIHEWGKKHNLIKIPQGSGDYTLKRNIGNVKGLKCIVFDLGQIKMLFDGLEFNDSIPSEVPEPIVKTPAKGIVTSSGFCLGNRPVPKDTSSSN